MRDEESMHQILTALCTKMKTIPTGMDFSDEQLLKAVETMTPAQLQIVATTGVMLATAGLMMAEMHQQENPFLTQTGRKETLH